MKPTVIQNSNSDNANINQTNSNQSDSNGGGNNAGPAGGGGNRRFPQFSQGFGFDDPDDDVFSNMGIRSRLNRMGHPFDWAGRKRGGPAGNPATSQYDEYFDNDFPHFGSTWDAFNRMGKRPAGEPHGFFDYLPQEFRQYMPEGFRFGGMRQAPAPSHEYVHGQHSQPVHHVPPSHAADPNPNQHQPTRGNQCDAAIQTEDPSNLDTTTGQTNLNQHGLRNTTDLGQRAAQEDLRGDRAQSAPPPNQNTGGNFNQASAFASNTSTPAGTQNFTRTSTNGPNAYASATTNPSQGHFYPGHQQFNYSQPQAPNMFHQGQQFQGHPEHFAQQYAQPFMQQPHQQQQHQSTSQTTQSTPSAPNQNENIRNVPIFVEGRNEPIVVKNVPTQQQQAEQQSQQQQQQQQTQASQASSTQQIDEPIQAPPSHVPIPAPAPEPRQQPTRPEPLVVTNDLPQGVDTTDQAAVPQTPHTIDCISKIQAIQRDVLELMCAVEQFGGKRGDKEYAYLDEMLTRNLLKLDTIDTNGKDNIRLARKEAIKCIQASIAVLEAKADLDLNNSRKGSLEADSDKKDTTTTNEKVEQMEVDASSDQAATATNDAKTNCSANDATTATNPTSSTLEQSGNSKN